MVFNIIPITSLILGFILVILNFDMKIFKAKNPSQIVNLILFILGIVLIVVSMGGVLKWT